MPVLDSKLRSRLDGVCQKARDKAEEAALSALQKRAVDAAEPHPHFTAVEKKLRNRLRARGRQAGDVRRANKTQGIEQLTQELAYESWHRMLFARFLAENELLIHPDGVAVSLEDCDELAPGANPPAPNGFVLAARYASKMLPQIFRTDDVLLEIEFAPEHRLALEKLLAGLPKETFMADDSLGWVYQFWQTKRKEEVNKSGEKIDGRTLSAVTQLFTEDYMVQFLLHNTIGAWWCARHGIEGPTNCRTDCQSVAEKTDCQSVLQVAGVPTGKAPVEMPYLRWRDDGTPAAGSFDGWPKTLKEFKMMDPCCGSGHFLVAAFNLLVPLRMHDEGLTAREACDAVLHENLFGLELDPRCTQIAAFALAVAAWKYPDLPSPSGRGAGGEGQPLGYRELPPLNIACTGIGPQATEEEWLKLAEPVGRIANPPYKPMSVLSREPILNGLGNLHALFSDAPTLGSLIDPNQLSADLITADYETLQPYLAAALTAETTDDDAHERAVAAAGMVKAAELLAGEYTLIATNVPYLGRGKQNDALREHLEKHFAEGKADLAAAFVLRCMDFCVPHGTAALVTPHNWLLLASYSRLRELLLKRRTWNLVARLGPGAFETIGGHVVNVALLTLSATLPSNDHAMMGIDVSAANYPAEKAALLCGKVPVDIAIVPQAEQLTNPDARLAFDRRAGSDLLLEIAVASQGIPTSDSPLFIRNFWEFPRLSNGWAFHQTTVVRNMPYGGRQNVILFENGIGRLRRMSAEQERDRRRDFQGANAWGKSGVAVSLMCDLYSTIYTGEKFDNNVSAIVPSDAAHVTAIWAYCTSPEFRQQVRRIDTKLNVTNATLVKVPFDLVHWQKVAAEKFPNGLPEPESDDPTQWLFHGRPEKSVAPLHVVLARLLGYRWPAELDAQIRLSKCAQELVKNCDELLKFADDDGIVCIPTVRAEAPADERVSEILHAAYGLKWSNSLLHDLLTDADCKPGTTLDDWLRNAFFEQHCSSKLFQNRPFIWQIWDGRKDGFSCLVNYHKLNYKTLDNLTHSYLESWIKKQAGDA